MTAGLYGWFALGLFVSGLDCGDLRCFVLIMVAVDLVVFGFCCWVFVFCDWFCVLRIAWFGLRVWCVWLFVRLLTLVTFGFC